MKNIILWGITMNELQPVNPPGIADTGCLPWCGWWRPVNPKQYEYFLNLVHDICRAVGGFPTPKHIEIALHIPKENRSQATVPFSNRLGSSSTPTMSTDVLQPGQSELMSRQLVVPSSSHRTSISIHTVCIWQPSFQRVHTGWKNTAWQAQILDPLFLYKCLEEDPTQILYLSWNAVVPLCCLPSHCTLKRTIWTSNIAKWVDPWLKFERSPIYLWCG